ncbi:peptidyl-prolyl cis-trans isomerase [Fusobacterium russii]|uniref:peptidylprolyl isomerase n=1 Tax=Fusobacterium russii TaxID=854 RepID=UPI0003AA9BA4|nr:peptidylprolyl isomerase [Fusobacterium russii]
MDNKIIHNVLLKKAKEANYKAFEIEQINYQYEAVLIDFYLRREAFEILNKIEVKEEELKKFYDSNKDRYVIEEQVKLDTIFFKDKENAKKIFEEVNTKNFKDLKKKYDEKVEVEELNEKLPLSSLHPQIAEAVAKSEEKGIVNELVEINEGAHIIYLKEKEKARLATFDEAKAVVLEEIKKLAFSQIYNDLINNIVNEAKSLDKNISLNEQKEEK